MDSRSPVSLFHPSGRSLRAYRISTATIGATLAGAFTVAAPGVAAAEDTLDPHCSQLDQTVTCVWDSPTETGDGYDFSLPADATDIVVTAIGGAGANGVDPVYDDLSIPGGSGAAASTTFETVDDLPSGDGTLLVLPGGDGGMDNGAPGQGSGGDGGAGGSASIVTTGAGEATPAGTVVFGAGGGGGGGAPHFPLSGGDGGDGAGFESSPLPDLTSIGVGGSGGAGGIGDISGDWNNGSAGTVGTGHGGDGGDGGRSGLGSADRGPGGDGGSGGDGGNGYGGHGGDGGSGGYWGGASGSTGGHGGDGYGAAGGDGAHSYEGRGGDGGNGGLSYIHGVSALTDGVWNVVGEPTNQAPGVTIVYTVPARDDTPDDGDPQAPPLLGSLLEWGPIISGSLAAGSAS